MTHPKQILSQADIAEAIGLNTRAILAMVRLLSERMPARPTPQADVLVTPGRTLPLRSMVTREESEAAYHARVGYSVSDREMIEDHLNPTRERRPESKYSR